MMSYLFDSNGSYKYINKLIPIADIEEQAEREIFTNTAMLIVAYIQRTNNTSARPDGISFSLYKVTQEKYFDMWVELIQQAGEIIEFPPSFGESQLCLIPKVKNIPRPDQFRPISVTNSDYRIVMRY